jgi:hypothetical protein
MSLHEQMLAAVEIVHGGPSALDGITIWPKRDCSQQTCVALDLAILAVPQSTMYVAITARDSVSGELFASPAILIERCDWHDRLHLQLHSLRGAEPKLLAHLIRCGIDIVAETCVRDALDCTRDMHLTTQLDLRATTPCLATITQCAQRPLKECKEWHNPLTKPWLPKLCNLYTV